MTGAIVNTCANPVPMSGWTAADFLDSAKRLREYEVLSLADDWADQFAVAAKLIEVHGELVAALQSVLAPRGGTMALGAQDDRVTAIRAALAKAGAA